MFSLWTFVMSGNIMLLIFHTAFIDITSSPFARYPRMAVFHRICSIRNALLPFISPRPAGMGADARALDEIVNLYHPPLQLTEHLTDQEIASLRNHSKQMLIGLHPARTPSCKVEYHIFDYEDNKVDMYSINHNQIDEWKVSDKPFILYFHGGGFVFGGIETYSGFECHLSKDLNMLVLHVNFGLTPEYSLEEIFKDVIGVYRVLLHVDPYIHRRLIGMGDSSGGMLWIHLLQWIVSNNRTVPLGVVLHSPWPNLYLTHMDYSIATNIYLTSDLIYSLRQIAVGRENLWFNLKEKDSSKYNPKVDVYQGFPPLYVTAGTSEIFISEIRHMIQKSRSVGVRVIYDEGVGMMHTYSLFHLWTSKARCVQRKIRQWVRERLLTNPQLTWNIEKESEIFC